MSNSRLVTLLIVLILAILVAGLYPRGLQNGSGVEWIADQPGIRFKGQGLAFTENLHFPDAIGAADFRLSFSIFPSPNSRRHGFQHIVTLYSGARETQFLVGQWRDHLIVMNGDDYDYGRRRPRLSAPIGNADSGPVDIMVAVNDRGSFLYIDGDLVDSIPDQLSLTPDASATRLLIGNSATGDYPWAGDITALQLVLDSPEEGASSYRIENGFTEVEGRRVEHRSEGGYHLLVPDFGSYIEPQFFTLDPGSGGYRWALRDWIVNFIGFVPFGVVLAVWLLAKKFSNASAVFVVGIAALLLSGSIELAQGWIPTRTSSAPDLALNIFGALVGAALMVLVTGRRLE